MNQSVIMFDLFYKNVFVLSKNTYVYEIFPSISDRLKIKSKNSIAFYYGRKQEIHYCSQNLD